VLHRISGRRRLVAFGRGYRRHVRRRPQRLGPALERDLDRFFLQPIANENQEHALELMKHPRTVVTFSDSGAHVSQIMDASLQTHVLSHWVRAKQALTLEQAVRMLSFEPATLRFVPPGDPATSAGAGEHVQCFRMVLDDDGVTALGDATSALRTRVFQDSGADINLDVRLHEVPAIDAGFSAFGSGLFLEPDALAAAALPMVSRETDLVYAVTGSGDPESGLSPRIDSCSGTNWLARGVIGGSAGSSKVASKAAR